MNADQASLTRKYMSSALKAPRIGCKCGFEIRGLIGKRCKVVQAFPFKASYLGAKKKIFFLHKRTTANLLAIRDRFHDDSSARFRPIYLAQREI